MFFLTIIKSCRSQALLAGFALISLLPAWAAQVSDGRVTVTMNASGSYQVASSITGWTFGGALPNATTQLTTTTGTDSVGAYQKISFSWLDASSRQMTGTINLYNAQDTVIFSDTLVAASAAAPSPFPNFITIPQGLSFFSYDNNNYFAPPTFGAVGENTIPWVLFDSSAHTLIFSPASHFTPAKLVGDGKTQMASGYKNALANPPAGFTQKTILSMSAGINHTFNIWGLALTNLYSKTRPAYDVDAILRYYGYWTDNFSAYYYNYNTSATAPGESAYEATLQNVIADFTQKGIPIHYLQLDSWWYDKSNVKYDGSDAGGYHPGSPQQPWALFGGELNWAGDVNLFPNGVGAYSQALGNAVSSPAIPFVCHARWVDTTAGSSSMSTFYSEFGGYGADFSGVAGISPRFWNSLAAYAKANNIQTFEEDWLLNIINNTPAFTSTVDTADNFYGNMASAFAAQGIGIQYCLLPASSYLQGSEYGNVTTTRVSGDGFNSGNYHTFLYVSRLASAVGIWPWTDVFSSTQTQNLLMSNLSAGPVGTGDALGSESASNLFLAIRGDGVIVKPDSAIVPTDASFIAESARTGVPLIASTTSNNGVTTTYAIAIKQSGSSNSTFGLSMSDLGITAPAYFYNYFSQTATLAQPGGTLSGQQIASGGVSYYVIAPVGQSGIAFMGDLGKFVSNGRKRIASVTDQSGQLTANVLFAPTESQVTLHGYSSMQPVVTVQSGTASPVSYNPATGHFTVVITASPSAPLNNDIDPASNVIVTFKTSNATAVTSTNALMVNSTGMALTPSGGGTANNTPLVQQPYTGVIGQLWNVNSLGNGRYDAIGVASGRSINVQGGPGATSPGTIIQLYDYKTESNEWFTLAPAGANSYSVLFVNSGLAMTVSGASTAVGAAIVQQPYTGGTNQQWSFQTVTIPQSGSIYHLICQTSEKALDNSGSTSNGGTVYQWTDLTGNSNQEWKLVSAGNGYYNLLCQTSGKALDNSGSTSNGGTVYQWTQQSGNTNQMWQLVNVGGGNYNLLCLTSGKALDNWGSLSNGQPVKQYTQQPGNPNQEWSFEFIR